MKGDRFPRSLNEAFGPYADSTYHSVNRESPLWWIFSLALIAGLVFLVVSQS